MNFIDILAARFVKSIRANYPNAASEKVLFYALSLLINTLIAFTVTLLICAFTHHLRQGLIVIAFYTLLRFFSGGVHFSTSVRCCVYSIVMFTIISHVNFNFEYLHLGAMFSIISALILIKTAPQGIKNMSKIDEKYYPLLKIISVALVLSNIYFESAILTAAFFIQAIHTSRFGYLVISIIEQVLNYTLGKGEVIHET